MFGREPTEELVHVRLPVIKKGIILLKFTRDAGTRFCCELF